MGKPLQDNFDEFAADYRQIHTANIRLSGADSGYFAHHKAGFIRDLEVRRGAAPGGLGLTILDLGCGDGETSAALSHAMPDARLTGVDISEESIKVARERALPGATFEVYDGENLSLPAHSHDLCLVANVLHHVDHGRHVGLLAQARRVLRPGGRLYIFEHNPYNPVTRHMVNTCPFDVNARLLTAGKARRTVVAAGYSKVRVRFILFMPRGGIFKPLLPLERHLEWLPLGGQYCLEAIA